VTLDDPDFLSNPRKQLAAVRDLANLRTRLVDLETELLARKHERRSLIERLTERDLTDQMRERGRQSRTAAHERARASQEVRNFDTNLRALSERIRRLGIDVERHRLSLDVATAAGDRGSAVAADAIPYAGDRASRAADM
jgi:predicted nuclease with TOPRIM domain